MKKIDVIKSYPDIFIFSGLLDYNEKVCKYWPEFANNGKEDITLEMYMTNKVKT